MKYPGIKDLKLAEGSIYDRSKPGRKGYSLPNENLENAENLIPEEMRRTELDLPEISELDAVRHYTRLSTYNFSLDGGFYPLGSCTMKYNPKINEKVARFKGFTDLHPETPKKYAQGTLKLMYELQNMLAEIGGFAGTTLNPAAGAHGEYTGIGVIKAYHKSRKDFKRTKVIIPDSAHGTNPASCAMNGYDVVVLKSNEKGRISIPALKELLNDETAAIMLTNPNTLGVFESEICEITKLAHEAGALIYGDGANMNAILGIARPGDMGIDVLHYNLHKTFSTPHGGGGPGSGPVCVAEKLIKFLPHPVVVKDGENYKFLESKESMGRVRSFYGNVGVCVKAYAYIMEMGKEWIGGIAENAVLNANYIKASLSDIYNVEYPEGTLHEAVLDDSKMPNDITTLDIAKALIDRGFHPPTIYFPTIIHGSIMIEPTETESKDDIDAFIFAMRDIYEKAGSNPENIKNAPLTTNISRPDETAAARKPILTQCTSCIN